MIKASLFIFLLLGFSSFQQPEEDVWRIEVKGADGDIGTIRIGIYNKANDFPNEKKQFKGLVGKTKKGTTDFYFRLPQGTNYAFAVFQDVNNNGKLDKSFLGIPTERYGFSNDAREMFSAPSFESATVKSSKKEVIVIHIE
jgi:uncharacterized protein (DUF2141 family)